MSCLILGDFNWHGCNTRSDGGCWVLRGGWSGWQQVKRHQEVSYIAPAICQTSHHTGHKLQHKMRLTSVRCSGSNYSLQRPHAGVSVFCTTLINHGKQTWLLLIILSWVYISTKWSNSLLKWSVFTRTRTHTHTHTHKILYMYICIHTYVTTHIRSYTQTNFSYTVHRIDEWINTD